MLKKYKICLCYKLKLATERDGNEKIKIYFD